MLTVKAAAQKIGVSESLIYEWCGEGSLVHYRFGRKGRRGKVMIEDADLDAFMVACKQEVRQTVPTLKHIKLT